MTKSKIIKPKSETWGKRGVVYVLRDEKGKLLNWVTRKNSGFRNLAQIQENYKQNRTLRVNVTATKLTNVSEYVYHVKGSFENRNKPPISSPFHHKEQQYQVSGYLGNQYIVARSRKIGSDESVKNKSHAKQTAWERFLGNIAGLTGGISGNIDEGIYIMDKGKIHGIKEGWVVYK
jgi:hypothetical protein